MYHIHCGGQLGTRPGRRISKLGTPSTSGALEARTSGGMGPSSRHPCLVKRCSTQCAAMRQRKVAFNKSDGERLSQTSPRTTIIGDASPPPPPHKLGRHASGAEGGYRQRRLDTPGKQDRFETIIAQGRHKRTIAPTDAESDGVSNALRARSKYIGKPRKERLYRGLSARRAQSRGRAPDCPLQPCRVASNRTIAS